MEFNTLTFLLFFPLITALYYLCPVKWRTAWLLAASWLFYMCWNYKYIFLLLFLTVLTFGAGLALSVCREKRKRKWLLAGCAACGLGVLFVFKYWNLFFGTLSAAARLIGLNTGSLLSNLLLPVGISFYVFQTLGYVIDVYRGDVEAERSFVRYAAFVAFFPQLVAGPIERSRNLLGQMKREHRLDPEACVSGFVRMLWGYFQKVVIADRIAVVVTAVYDRYNDYSGVYIVAATVLFAFQIYCDFDGYTNIAIGAARILGFDLMKNFDSPYLSKSVAEFWRRWHISLSTWFRDYLYIPLGGNRKGRAVKYRNVMITFLLSGLWHGANWTYVLWGGLHGLFQIVEDIFHRAFGKEKRTAAGNVLRCAATFCAVDFAWLFFRADSIGDAFSMLGRVFTQFHAADILNREMAITLGFAAKDVLVLLAALLILAVSDLFKDRLRAAERIAAMPVVLRFAALYAVIFAILIFGYYGPQYNASQFIYFQF